MLRILLIILVALAVIMGLMQLTNSRSGAPEPAPVADQGAVSADAPVAADEPAVDDTGALEGDLATDVLGAGEAEQPGDPGIRTGDNASPEEGPVTDPVPAIEEPLAEPAADPGADPAAPGP